MVEDDVKEDELYLKVPYWAIKLEEIMEKMRKERLNKVKK